MGMQRRGSRSELKREEDTDWRDEMGGEGGERERERERERVGKEKTRKKKRRKGGRKSDNQQSDKRAGSRTSSSQPQNHAPLKLVCPLQAFYRALDDVERFEVSRSHSASDRPIWPRHPRQGRALLYTAGLGSLLRLHSTQRRAGGSAGEGEGRQERDFNGGKCEIKYDIFRFYSGGCS